MAEAKAISEQILREHVLRIITEQYKRAESDMRNVLGPRVSWPAWAIQRLGYVVIWQRVPDGSVDDYRGIRRHGRWVIDHHPDWPFEGDTTP